MRFPIADAHYAMGFAFLYQATGDSSQLENAIQFLTELKKSRCYQFKEYCWGYPFNWVTRNGTIKEQTPLITTTPYCYEAFLQVFELTGQDEWKVIVESIARHAAVDIKDFRTSERASSCSYTPFDKGGVVNAAAYRAFLLTSASKIFCNERLLENRRTKFEFRVGEPEPRRLVVLRNGWSTRLCRPLSHLFRDESVG